MKLCHIRPGLGNHLTMIPGMRKQLTRDKQGRIQDFSKGGLKAMVMYKLYIAIIHIIILNKVHAL